jgi:hypothetical protein
VNRRAKARATVQSIADNSQDASPRQPSQASVKALFFQPAFICGLVVSFVFAGLLCFWHSMDSRQPSMDEAGHILCAFTYADLFSHPHVLKGSWWHSLLLVNNFYPPAVYAFNGFLKIVLGPEHFVDWISLAIYDFVLTSSIFAMTMILTGKRLAAVVAACAVNFYTGMLSLSHTFLLDFQVAAMISMGLFCLVWWRQQPTWKKTILCGVSLALVLASKQIAGAFLAGAGIYYFLGYLIKKPPGWKLYLGQLAVMALIAIVAMVPWAVASYGFISEFAETNKKVIASTVGAITVPQALQRGLRYYTFQLPYTLTPLLLVVALISMAFCGLKTHLRLMPVLLSAMFGIVLISLLPWQYPQVRYSLGALVAPAVYTGAFLSQAWEAKFKWAPVLPKLLVGLLSAVAVLQYLSFCFFPYPFAKPEFMVNFSNLMGLQTTKMGLDTAGKATPDPYQDWGQKWALEIIGKRDPNAPVWLNVMANHVEFNPHTFTLQGKYMGSKVKPTSSRTWTVLGDTVTFSNESTLYYQWYLIKTGNVGLKLLNEESKVANANILRCVRESGKFELIAQRKVPDGSEIFLYRQK